MLRAAFGLCAIRFIVEHVELAQLEHFQSGVVLSRERQTTTLTEKLAWVVVCRIPLNELFALVNCCLLMNFTFCFASSCSDGLFIAVRFVLPIHPFPVLWLKELGHESLDSICQAPT